MIFCVHIYQILDEETCPHCGEFTNEIDWEENNRISEQWRLDNPNAGEGVWWSI